MKAPYRNALRSQEMIRKAMLDLLDRKQLEDITVTDIVREANINRGTFYNHYNNPIEILEEYKDELFNKLTTAIQRSKATADVDGFVDTVVEHFMKNETEYRRFVKAIPMSIIDQIKQELIKQIQKFNLGIDQPTLYYIVNGLTGLYLDYLKNDLKLNYSEFSIKIKWFIHSAIQK